MKTRHVLISGAGVAGPSLALCLARAGFTATVVERAPALREGGQAVDFRGPVHRAVLERLDLWDPIHARRTRASPLCLLDRAGRTVATIPEVMASGDVEILRGDLVRLLYERSRASADYRFGDRVVAIEDRGDRVAVELERGGTLEADLVVGADGLHSGVRELAFTEEASVLRHHGYRIATFGMQALGEGVPDAFIYSAPGRGVSVSANGRDARALLIYTGAPLASEERRDLDALRREIRERFAGLGWQTGRVLDALDAADLYVDAVATVHVDRYARGRVALLGDAAYGGTLGGQGTPLAVVGAYVLATELARDGDLASALARYEATMRPYATRCQKTAMRVGSFFAPKTRAGLWLRDAFHRVLTSKPLVGVFEWMVKDAATDFVLPEGAIA